jgi:hypothetical protein
MPPPPPHLKAEGVRGVRQHGHGEGGQGGQACSLCPHMPLRLMTQEGQEETAEGEEAHVLA